MIQARHRLACQVHNMRTRFHLWKRKSAALPFFFESLAYWYNSFLSFSLPWIMVHCFELQMFSLRLTLLPVIQAATIWLPGFKMAGRQVEVSHCYPLTMFSMMLHWKLVLLYLLYVPVAIICVLCSIFPNRWSNNCLYWCIYLASTSQFVL